MKENQKEKGKTGEKALKLIVSSTERKIPKYANRVIFNRTEGGIVMMFLLMEQAPEGELGTLIESIIVDKKHAKQIVEVLSKFLVEEEPEKE